MNIVSYMPPETFDIRAAMGIESKRSTEIEQGVKDVFEFTSQEKGIYEMSTIIEDCLNTIPNDTPEAVWTMVLIMKYEEIARHKTTGLIN